MKLPTASRAKGLGNGHVAGELQVDVTQLAGAWSFLASAARGFRGRADGDRDTWTLSAGLGRTLTDRFAVGAIYEWRTSAGPGGGAHQGTIYGSYDLTPAVSLTAYGGAGFSRASPDAEFGLRLSYRW